MLAVTGGRGGLAAVHSGSGRELGVAEYIPFARRLPWLYRLTPLSVGLDAGAEPAAFRAGPLLLSPNNNKTLYVGSNHLLMSTDRGATWRIASPDLSKNDPERTIRKSGGMTPDENPGGGAEYHATIITISESPLEPGNIWVGTDDGNIQVTRDGGATWTRVGTQGMPGLPQADLWVSRVEASHHTRGVAYATVAGHRNVYLP